MQRMQELTKKTQQDIQTEDVWIIYAMVLWKDFLTELHLDEKQRLHFEIAVVYVSMTFRL